MDRRASGPFTITSPTMKSALRALSWFCWPPLKQSRLGRVACSLTPREFDKLVLYMVADVALKRKAKGLKLNYPEAVGVISAVALDGARAGKTIEDVTSDARAALTKADVEWEFVSIRPER